MTQTTNQLAAQSQTLETGECNDARPNRRADEIEVWLVDKLATILNCFPQDIEVDQPFADFGLNSLAALTLSGEIESWLGCTLPTTVAWDYPTIELLSRHLADQPRTTGE